MVIAKRLGVLQPSGALRGPGDVRKRRRAGALQNALASLFIASAAIAQQQSDYYRIETYELPQGVNFEASGLAVTDKGQLAVALRKGEVWIEGKDGFQLFASGLHELLGLAWHDGALYATQRAEVTKLRDTDGDGKADEYLTASTGWGVSGAYHEYAYGPVFDAEGNAFTSLNCSMGKAWKGAGDEEKHPLWRGWVVRMTPQGRLEPWSAGFRSPCGIGQDADGEIFVTDQQGNWMPTTPLFHIRKGAYFSHADSIPDAMRPESPVKIAAKQPDGTLTVAEAMKTVQGYCPPAVWLPYVKMGQSGTGITCDKSGGKFGPFEKQLFIGEFVLSGVNRVFLEKVGGEYQGACFPFVDGLQCAALALTTLPDGSLVVGESNRGWNSKGNRPFGLQKVVWTGKTPLEVQKLELTETGFRFTFTLPVDKASVGQISGQSYTYPFQSKYGGEELDAKPLQISEVKLSGDGLNLEVTIANLREGYVHEFELPQLKAKDGTSLWHRMAFYTLNRLRE